MAHFFKKKSLNSKNFIGPAPGYPGHDSQAPRLCSTFSLYVSSTIVRNLIWHFLIWTPLTHSLSLSLIPSLSLLKLWVWWVLASPNVPREVGRYNLLDETDPNQKSLKFVLFRFKNFFSSCFWLTNFARKYLRRQHCFIENFLRSLLGSIPRIEITYSYF